VRGWGQGGEMTQALYAHMNNKKIIIVKYSLKTKVCQSISMVFAGFLAIDV
jgi:transcription antitermination factor NusA-like protein